LDILADIQRFQSVRFK